MNPEKVFSNTKATFEELISSVTINDNGNASWVLDTDFLLDGILAYDSLNDDLDNAMKITQLKSALVLVLKEKSSNMTVRDIAISTIKRYKSNCSSLSVKSTKYRLVTTINLPKTTKLPKRRIIDDCQIRFYKELTNELRKNRLKIFSDQASDYSPCDDKDFIYVSVTVLAPNARTAVNKSMSSLSIYRALINLSFTKSIQIMPSKYREMYDSKSRVKVGAFHTLHAQNNKPVQHFSFWFEVGYEYQGLCGTDIEKLEGVVDKKLSLFRSSPIKQHLRKSLITYIEALDSVNREYRFTKLWSAFEILLKADNTKELAKRISSFYKDKALAKEKIYASREARNRVAHAGISGHEFDLKCFELMNHFENCIRLYLGNPFRFKRVEDFTRFVSAPRKLEEIEAQLQMLKIAKRYCDN